MQLASAASAALILLLSAAVAAHANNGMDDVGVSLRQLGRGGTYIAAGAEAAAVEGNPAALALLDWPEFELDLRYTANDLGYYGTIDSVPHATYRIAPRLAYAAPLSRRLAWGAGLRSVGGTEVQFTGIDLGLGGRPLGNGIATAALAWRASDKTALGASLSLGRMDVDFHFLGDSVGFNVDRIRGSGHALRLGLSHQAGPRTRLGVVWRSRSHLRGGGGTLSTGPHTELAGQVFPDVELRGFNFAELYGLGLAQQLDQCWTGYAEYRKLRWDGAVNTLDFTSDGLETVSLNLNWKSQDVYVLGAEYRPQGPDGAVWRAGVDYARSAPRPRGVNPLFPNIQEWHLTAGYESPLSAHWRIATAVLYAPQSKITTAADSSYNFFFGRGEPYTVANEGLQLGVGLIYNFDGWSRHAAPAEEAQSGCCAQAAHGCTAAIATAVATAEGR